MNTTFRFALVGVLLLAGLAAGQSVEERLTKIEQKLEKLEKLLQVKRDSEATKSVVVTFEPYSWLANPNTGKVIRTDSRTGEVSVVHTAKAGKWEVLKADPFSWLLSSGGTILRVDRRNGESTAVFTGKTGSWDFVTKSDGPYIILTQSETGAVLRLDKRNGDSSIVDKGK